MRARPREGHLGRVGEEEKEKHCFSPRLSNPRPTRFYYAARSHTCKLYI